MSVSGKLVVIGAVGAAMLAVVVLVKTRIEALDAREAAHPPAFNASPPYRPTYRYGGDTFVDVRCLEPAAEVSTKDGSLLFRVRMCCRFHSPCGDLNPVEAETTRFYVEGGDWWYTEGVGDVR